MGYAHFTHADFLDAARELAAELGPAGVTVGLVNERLKARRARFTTALPLATCCWGAVADAALAYQEGFVAAIEAGEGLRRRCTCRPGHDSTCTTRALAALQQARLRAGRLAGITEESVADQARRFEACLQRFAREAFGGVDPSTSASPNTF